MELSFRSNFQKVATFFEEGRLKKKHEIKDVFKTCTYACILVLPEYILAYYFISPQTNSS